MALGFSAIQLNHDLIGVSLESLNGSGRLTDPIARADAEIPGDATTRAALGYLHANCGHCHGGESTFGAGDGSPPLHMRLEVGVNSVEATDTYVTAVDVLANWQKISTPRHRIDPGSAEDSAIYVRMGLRGFDQMPPLGTRVVDDAGRATVAAWITSL
jgi:mono/diheme cytochrome c family protein